MKDLGIRSAAASCAQLGHTAVTALAEPCHTCHGETSC